MNKITMEELVNIVLTHSSKMTTGSLFKENVVIATAIEAESDAATGESYPAMSAGRSVSLV